MFRSLALALASFVALASAPAGGQTLQPPFDTDYSIVDLGGVPSLPTPFGGLTFKAGDPNTILIGGAANSFTGKIYSIGVTRDAGQHVNGFTGTATSSPMPTASGAVASMAGSATAPAASSSTRATTTTASGR